MNPSNPNAPQRPYPGAPPLNYNFQAGQHMQSNTSLQPGQQMGNPSSGLPQLKINPLLMKNSQEIQDLNRSHNNSSDESSQSLTYDTAPKEKMNMQFTGFQGRFPVVKVEPNTQNQGMKQGSSKIQMNSQGIPVNDPSIPQIHQAQNNIPTPYQNSQAMPQLISPKNPANFPQNIPIKSPQFIPTVISNAPQLNQPNQQKFQYPNTSNPQSQINQPNQPNNQFQSFPKTQSQINQPNFNPQFQDPQNLPNLSNPQFPNSPNPQFQNFPNPQFQNFPNSQFQNPPNPQSQNPPNPQFQNSPNPQNLASPQFNPAQPQSKHMPFMPPQNQQDIPENFQSTNSGVPTFTPQKFSGPNIPPPPLTGKSNIGFPPISNLVKPPPPQSPANQQVLVNSAMPPQDGNLQISGRPQFGIPNFPSTGINTGPAFPQKVTNSIEEPLPDLSANQPQGNLSNAMTPPPKVNNPPQIIPNALPNPPPMKNLQSEDASPKFFPNPSKQPFGQPFSMPFSQPPIQPPNQPPNQPPYQPLNQRPNQPLNQPPNQPNKRPDGINQPFSIPQKNPSMPPANEGMLIPQNPVVTISIDCPALIASKLINRRIREEIKIKYNLTSVQYTSTAFILIGTTESVRQAERELKGTIARENELGNVSWEWLRDDGSFEAYPDTLNTIIENAWSRRDKIVSITIGSVNYNIIFGNPHIQVYPNSNIHRTVRRNDGTQQNVDRKISENEVTWYWQDDDKVFKKYTAEASRQIEAAYREKNNGALVQGTNIKGYLIDFKQKIQENERTHFKRKIRRENDSL